MSGNDAVSDLLKSLQSDCLVYPHQLDMEEDRVLLVLLNEHELREHSFLDQRIFRPDMEFEWRPWSEFATEAELLAHKAPNYIFHIGHCGSTLLSRLVAAATGTLALREPVPLRVFAIDRVDGDAGVFGNAELRRRLGLFERAWARGDKPVTVKATSMCTNLIDVVDGDASIVFVYQAAATHLAVTLAGENVLQDLQGFGQNRFRRLNALAHDLPPLEGMSIGELAAMNWLAEISSAAEALEHRPGMKLDFDEFLQQPEQHLATVCSALGYETTVEQCSAAVSGAIMRTYSKAPEHAYGPKLRDDIIADSRGRNADEIAKGMELIDRFRTTTCGGGWR